LVNILILRLCNYDKSPDHVESAGKFTLSKKCKHKPVQFEERPAKRKSYLSSEGASESKQGRAPSERQQCDYTPVLYLLQE
jgi:hypothetical protein